MVELSSYTDRHAIQTDMLNHSVGIKEFEVVHHELQL